jgi:Asp/Glu/hydantoin racemase
MADRAVQMGSKIGVVATLWTTLESTSDLVLRRAALARREIGLTSRLCEGAFDALMSGNPNVHDESVARALKELSRQVDVILLAQASMARVANQLSDKDKKVPILTSPELAMQYLADVL